MDSCHGMQCCFFSSHTRTLYLFCLFDSFWIRCSTLSKRSNFICSPDFVFPYTLVLKYHADSIPSLSRILLISSRFLFVTSSVKWTLFLRFFLCFIISTFASAQEKRTMTGLSRRFWFFDGILWIAEMSLGSSFILRSFSTRFARSCRRSCFGVVPRLKIFMLFFREYCSLKLAAFNASWAIVLFVFTSLYNFRLASLTVLSSFVKLSFSNSNACILLSHSSLFKVLGNIVS